MAKRIMHRFKRFNGILWIVLVLCCSGQTAFAHPHAFVTCAVRVVMDEDGLVGFHQRWTLDAMTTVSVLDVIDQDHNAILSPDEREALRDLTVSSLKDYRYFTALKVNAQKFPVRTISDFSAELKNNQLIYDFLVPCRVAAPRGKRQQVKLAVYDSSFYTYVAYASDGDTPIDPTKDPRFADRGAPISPDDYNRFAEAVGLSRFEGTIPVVGTTKPFNITISLEAATDMAYFHDQIVPQSIVLSFEPK